MKAITFVDDTGNCIEVKKGFIFVKDKNGRFIQRRQTINEKYAEKIIQYINSDEFNDCGDWSIVGKKIVEFLKQYKRASN